MTLKEEVAAVREDLAKSWDRAATHDAYVARLAVENSKLTDELGKVNVDAEEARSNFVRSQGPLIQASLYKII